MFGSDALFAAGAYLAIVWDGRIGVKLAVPDEFSALLASGADRWSPTGKAMGGWLLVPEEFHDEPEALRPWLERAHRSGLQAGFAKRAKTSATRAPRPAARKAPARQRAPVKSKAKAKASRPGSSRPGTGARPGPVRRRARRGIAREHASAEEARAQRAVRSSTLAVPGPAAMRSFPAWTSPCPSRFMPARVPRRPSPASSGRCGGPPRRSRRRSRPRTSSCSRCPTRARRSGTSRTRPGSSRRSCSCPQLAGYRPFHPQFGYLFNSLLRRGRRPRHARPQRGLLVPAVARRGDRVPPRTSTRGCSSCSRDRRATQLCAVVRARPATTSSSTRSCSSPTSSTRSRRTRSGPSTRAAGAAPRARAARSSGSAFETGIRRLGHAGGAFAFDNEGPAHDVLVPAFELASRPVTCGEFQRVHRRRRLRAARALALGRLGDRAAAAAGARRSTGSSATASGTSFTLDGMRRVEPDEPRSATLSYYEADAFARWAGARLPTEVEWEIAARDRPGRGEPARGRPAPPRARERRARPAAALRRRLGVDRVGLRAVPRLPPAAGALGEYNGKFMCNQLVLRGGSCATPRSHIRPTYRNFFPPHARWQFSGVRLARSV